MYKVQILGSGWCGNAHTGHSKAFNKAFEPLTLL
jgi:hypothetical protein